MLNREIRETRELVSCYSLVVLKGARRFSGYQRIPPDASLGTERGPSRPAARPCVAYRTNVSLWLGNAAPPALIWVFVLIGIYWLLVIFCLGMGRSFVFFPPMVSLRENRFRKIMKKFSAAERGPSRPAALRTLLVASKPAPN